MRFQVSYVFAVLLVACLAASSPAKTIYVNNVAGSDTNTGALPDLQGGDAGPVRTIQRALQLTFRGDHVELANTDVPYQECVTLEGARHSGYSFAPFVIDGNGATLAGTAPVPAGQWEFIQGDLYRFAPERGGHQMLFLNGKPAKEMPRFDSSYVSTFLKPSEWCRCRGGIHFMVEKGKSPFSYDLEYARERVGITLYNVEHVVIQNLNIRGYQLDGINAADNAMECVVADVNCVANGRSGISINGASRVKVVRSRAFDNAETQLRCADWSTTQLIDSEMYSETRAAWTRHVNAHGQGARLTIDDERQVDLEGWKQGPERRSPDEESSLPTAGTGDSPEAVDDAPLNLGSDASDETADEEAADSESLDDGPGFLDEVAPGDADEASEDDDGLSDDTDDDPFGDLELDDTEETLGDPFDDF